MADDIVTQLEWLHSEFYDVDSVTSIVELAKAEIKRLCAERDQLLIDCAELRDGLGRKHDHAWRMDALAEKRLMEGTRLRAERDASRLLSSDLTAENERLQAENKRLRAAGDVLAHLMPSCFSVPCRPPQGTPLDEWCSECAALVAWQEARRG